MNYEEDYIKSKMGNKNPFSVPEGYFDTLTEQVMRRLPEQVQPAIEQKQKHSAIVRMLRPVLYAAACLCLGIFGVGIYQYFNNQTAEGIQTASNIISATDYNDTFIDEATDYAMFDKQDIYATLLADM